MSEFPRRSANKVGRPPGSLNKATIELREAIERLTWDYAVMTVRQAFYALVVRARAPKTPAGYRQVQRQILDMRRAGELDWSFIADLTRWQRKPETWDRHEDALRATINAYRRNLWQAQGVRVEVWLEKDALAGFVSQATCAWDVALMVSRGQSSDTFAYNAARVAAEAYLKAGIETYIFTLYDGDKAGRDAERALERKLREYSYGAPINFSKLAIHDWQIDEWNLPTRFEKTNRDERAVELDAIPPEKLVELVDNAIVGLIDRDAWEKQKQVEASERDILARLQGAA